MSPKTLLGGGRVHATHEAQDASETQDGNVVAGALAASGAQPLTVSEVAARANIREEVAAEMLARLTETRRVVVVSKPQAYLDGAAAQALLERTVAILARRQHEAPWIAGTTSLALARDLEIPEALLLRLLAAFADDGAIASRGGYFSTTDYTPQLTPEQRAFFDEHVAPQPDQPFVPVALAELVSAVKSSRVPGIAQAFDALLFRGALVKVGQDVYLGRQIETIQGRVEAFLLREKQMTMAQFRDLAGSSRKYAVPLLEWFDARGITVRSGDFRMLRAKRAS
jgi:selenocysteine-specific elongation factor